MQHYGRYRQLRCAISAKEKGQKHHDDDGDYGPEHGPDPRSNSKFQCGGGQDLSSFSQLPKLELVGVFR